MSYTDTFIRVAVDCPAETGVVPVSVRPHPPVHVIQYELLSGAPYAYTHEELLYEVHVRHKEISEQERAERRKEIWTTLFSKSHPCLRASMLPKKYGWGIHYNAEGKIAIYGKESPEYDHYTSGSADGVKLLNAMRNRK
ncbi:DUF6157 family protein [Paenibacillus jilunlii]|uniref:Uncharacterized protein n=1 Tax=Paenibacillus jilunlii TaxID=682956 RepID=A0A1G9G6F2_9BACL|nr:DUF6157 family protein [Paenibacillus jilunlii]KWX71357.1 hypothetical protein AML91_24365 [Paenibacillus jilunlii]SDK96185.1 hypothetical protein SAMN05216191_101241 [Paenibacillus jilunlii]